MGIANRLYPYFCLNVRTKNSRKKPICDVSKLAFRGENAKHSHYSPHLLLRKQRGEYKFESRHFDQKQKDDQSVILLFLFVLLKTMNSRRTKWGINCAYKSLDKNTLWRSFKFRVPPLRPKNSRKQAILTCFRLLFYIFSTKSAVFSWPYVRLIFWLFIGFLWLFLNPFENPFSLLTATQILRADRSIFASSRFFHYPDKLEFDDYCFWYSYKRYSFFENPPA